MGSEFRVNGAAVPAGEPAGAGPGLRLGVLALQGDFRAHREALLRADPGVEVVEVRRPGQLAGLAGVVIPGGESTTLLKLCTVDGMDEALVRFHVGGGVLFGTCAGLILLAREVSNPSQRSLGLIDVAAERNGFGRQRESFVDNGHVTWGGSEPEEMEMVFIRAPRITRVGPAVRTLGTWRGEPVLVAQERVFGATFHPELTPAGWIHGRFLAFVGSLVRSRWAAGSLAAPESGPGPAATFRPPTT